MKDDIKSQDDIKKQDGRDTDVLLVAIKRCNELKKENDILWESLTASGLVKCPKCGYYHKRDFTCWYCGYDKSLDKELGE